MSYGKKDRMAMLDGLSGSPAPLASKSSSRPLRAARDAVDAHRVWELDPDQIEDTRVADRLNQKDVDDLRVSIETSGQTVPILVRRHPTEEDRYLLVYGRRRLEAIRSSKEVNIIKALIANIDDQAAVEAQISENTARRDLTYIEKARFAHDLVKSGFGSQARVAEVLGETKSWMSMAMSIVETVTPEVIRSIGPVPGVGRPRWETFAKAIKAKKGCTPKVLVDLAEHQRGLLQKHPEALEKKGTIIDPSVAVLEALEGYVRPRGPDSKADREQAGPRPLSISGTIAGSVKRSGKKVRLEIEPGEFADFVEENAEYLMVEMHKYWREEQDKKSN